METLKGGKVIAIAAVVGRSKKVTRKTVVIGTVVATIAAGQHKSVVLLLNGTGKRLLAARHVLKVNFAITQAGKTLSSSAITFKTKPKNHRTR